MVKTSSIRHGHGQLPPTQGRDQLLSKTKAGSYGFNLRKLSFGHIRFTIGAKLFLAPAVLALVVLLVCYLAVQSIFGLRQSLEEAYNVRMQYAQQASEIYGAVMKTQAQTASMISKVLSNASEEVVAPLAQAIESDLRTESTRVAGLARMPDLSLEEKTLFLQAHQAIDNYAKVIKETIEFSTIDASMSAVYLVKTEAQFVKLSDLVNRLVELETQLGIDAQKRAVAVSDSQLRIGLGASVLAMVVALLLKIERGAQQRGARCGDDVMPDLVGQMGRYLGGQGQGLIVGKADRATVVAPDHAGFDAGGVELRGGVDMGKKADGGAGGGGGQGGEHGAVVGEGDVGGSNLGQFLNEEPGHIELDLGGRRGFAGGIRLAVDRAIAGEAGFEFCVHVGHGRAFDFCAPVGPGRRPVSTQCQPGVKACGRWGWGRNCRRRARPVDRPRPEAR